MNKFLLISLMAIQILVGLSGCIGGKHVPTGQFAYVANSGSDNISVYSINATTGALTAVGSPVAAGDSPGLIAIVKN